LLLPDRAGEYRVGWRAANRPKDPAPTFELLDPDTGQAVDPNGVWGLGRPANWPPKDEGSQARFVRRLLVTEVVRDIRGQLGQERYLGLYEPAPGGTALRCVHRSPALAPMEREEALARVRLRVVEFQEADGRARPEDWQFNPALPDVWDDAIGPTAAPAADRTADSPARVVSVSPPVTVPAIPVPL
jgi:hypothetical protein